MTRQRKVEGWFRQLDGDRIEIFLKVEAECKVRASGPEAQMYELVDWFEEKTGLRVNADWRRVRKGPKPIEGQTSMIPEVQSGLEPNESDIGGWASMYDTPEVH